MKRIALWMTVSALTCLSIITSTVAVQQTMEARNSRALLDEVLSAQAEQPTIGWEI